MKKNSHEELIKEKHRLQLKASLLESRLKEDFFYLQDNSRDILISSGITLLKPSRSKRSRKHSSHPENKKEDKNILGGIVDYAPAMWDFFKPMVLAWGVRSFKGMITRAFTSKQKRKRK